METIMSNLLKQKILKCYHCGNETLMNIVGNHEERWDEGFPYEGIEEYEMCICPVCKGVTLVCGVWQERARKITSKVIKEEYLFPALTLKENYIPNNVKDAFESAIKTKEIDKAICLIALRRTLEIICIEKNAQGNNLRHKIEYLSNIGILPPALKHASIITKTYGNMGAHENNVTITNQDLEKIFDFVRYLLDYLYVLPEKINEIQQKMDTLKTAPN